MQEAKAASSLDHPNICTIYEIDETDNGQLFLAMGFCEGGSLETKLEAGPLPVGRVLDIAMQIAGGLAEAHSAGIVHRDIKPGNIVFGKGDVAKIVDFGLAKLVAEPSITHSGMIRGTVAYMSPEQVQGEQVDHRPDIWALGVVLYEMLSGRRPFRSESPMLVANAILTKTPSPVTDVRDDMAPPLQAVVDRMLAKKVDDRYQSPAHVLSALRDLRQHAENQVASDSTPTAGDSWSTYGDPIVPTTAPGQLAPGTQIGSYEIHACLGYGSWGAVYKGFDPNLQRSVAIKIVERRGDTPVELIRSRLLQEARNASPLQHANICAVFEVGDHGGLPFIVYEYIDGDSLGALIPPDGWAADTVVRYGIQMAAAVAYTHDHGLVHGDIKPYSFIVSRDGQVKLVEFGPATRFDQADSGGVKLPRTIEGTLRYLSPEALQGQTARPEQDVWAMGVTLYQMTTGTLPFTGSDEKEIIRAIQRGSPAPLSQDVPPGLRALIQRCLSKEPTQRYANGTGVLANLEGLQWSQNS